VKPGEPAPHLVWSVSSHRAITRKHVTPNFLALDICDFPVLYVGDGPK
jgi:hypothetical protein